MIASGGSGCGSAPEERPGGLDGPANGGTCTKFLFVSPVREHRLRVQATVNDTVVVEVRSICVPLQAVDDWWFDLTIWSACIFLHRAADHVRIRRPPNGWDLCFVSRQSTRTLLSHCCFGVEEVRQTVWCELLHSILTQNVSQITPPIRVIRPVPFITTIIMVPIITAENCGYYGHGDGRYYGGGYYHGHYYNPRSSSLDTIFSSEGFRFRSRLFPWFPLPGF